jgi:hypothetical protein
MSIIIKPWSFFWILSIAVFAVFCIWLAAVSMTMKMLLIFLVLAVVCHDIFYTRAKMIHAIKLFPTGQYYWLLTYKTEQCFAQLLPRKTYQSQYFICLFWRHVTQLSSRTLKKHNRHTVLCRWHYDAETWRILQVCLTTYPRKI